MPMHTFVITFVVFVTDFVCSKLNYLHLYH